MRTVSDDVLDGLVDSWQVVHLENSTRSQPRKTHCGLKFQEVWARGERVSDHNSMNFRGYVMGLPPDGDVDAWWCRACDRALR